jgi:G3E family GTPase
MASGIGRCSIAGQDTDDQRAPRDQVDRALNIKGSPSRFVFQAVHMLIEGDDGKRWEPGKARDSKLVFIGRGLDETELRTGFGTCVAA